MDSWIKTKTNPTLVNISWKFFKMSRISAILFWLFLPMPINYFLKYSLNLFLFSYHAWIESRILNRLIKCFTFVNIIFGGGNGKPFQYSCPENSMTEEPGRLQSMGSQSIGDNRGTKTTIVLSHRMIFCLRTYSFLIGECYSLQL